MTSWEFSIPVCFFYNLSFQEYARVFVENSEQRKEMSYIDGIKKQYHRARVHIPSLLTMIATLLYDNIDSSLRNIVEDLTAEQETMKKTMKLRRNY